MKIFRPYQKEAFKYARSTRHPGLFLEMRLGKTLITIRTIKAYKKKEKQKILIALPSEAIPDWIDELSEEKQHNVCTLIHPVKQKRIELLNRNAQWNFINYEGIRAIGKELLEIDWNVVVLDESVFVKNPKAQVSKFFVNNFRGVDHRWALSGCADPEDDLDWVQQLRWLDYENLDGDDYWKIRNGKCKLSGFKHKLIPKYKDWLRTKIALNCLTMKRKDVGFNQEQIHERLFLTLPSELKNKYKNTEDTWILELDGKTKDTMTSLVTNQWLKEIASGIVDGEVINNFKVKELINLLDNQLKNEQVVIWSHHRAELKAIEKEFIKNKYSYGVIHGGIPSEQRTITKKYFQKKKIKYLLANPDTFKYGTNASAASSMIYFSIPQSLNTYIQSRDRTVDVDKEGSLLILYLLTKDTVDEDDYNRIRQKQFRSYLNHKVIKQRTKQND